MTGRINGLFRCAALALIVAVSFLGSYGLAEAGSIHRRQATLVRLPDGHRVVRVNGQRYYCQNGVFYQKERSGYVVVSAPIDATVAVLPAGSKIVWIGGIKYYHSGRAYYRKSSNGFIVVRAPEPVTVASSPPVIVPSAQMVSNSVSVTAHTLNVRTGPGKSHPVVGQVYRGNRLMVQGKAPGWLHVRMPSGQSGWVAGRFTAPVRSPARG